MSVFAARWRRPSPIGLTPVRLDDFVDAEAWVETAPLADAAEGSTLLLLADPFSVYTRRSARRARRAAARHRRGRRHGVGSPGSGRQPARARRPGRHDGAVGVLLDPAAQIGTIVSQGCRPIGEPLIVTKSERNVIYELGGGPRSTACSRACAPLPPTTARWPRTACTSVGSSTSRRPTSSRGDFLDPQRPRGRQRGRRGRGRRRDRRRRDRAVPGPRRRVGRRGPAGARQRRARGRRPGVHLQRPRHALLR